VAHGPAIRYYSKRIYQEQNLKLLKPLKLQKLLKPACYNATIGSILQGFDDKKTKLDKMDINTFTFHPRAPHEVFDLVKKINDGDKNIRAFLKKVAIHSIFWADNNYLIVFDTSYITGAYTVFIYNGLSTNKASFKLRYFACPPSIDIEKTYYKDGMYYFSLPNKKIVSTNFRQLGLIDHQIPFRREKILHVENIFQRFENLHPINYRDTYEVKGVGMFDFLEEYGFCSSQEIDFPKLSSSISVCTSDLNVFQNCMKNFNIFREKFNKYETVCRNQLIDIHNLTQEEIQNIRLIEMVLYPEGEFDIRYDGSPDFDYVGGLFSAGGEFVSNDFGNY